MKILKKLPKWAVIALVLVLIAFMASTLIRHITVSNRVNDQKERIQERQRIIQQERENLPKVPDIWD